jgi:NIMA (never in mitosis gene a)-related kinase 8
MVESRETTETQESSEKPKRDYKKVKTIGRGAFGTASLVKSESRNKYCVIKTIDMASMSSKDKKAVLQEAELLKAQDHPNIIQFIEVF